MEDNNHQNEPKKLGKPIIFLIIILSLFLIISLLKNYPKKERTLKEIVIAKALEESKKSERSKLSPNEMIEKYNQIFEQSPKDAEAYLNRGDLYISKGNFRKALSDINQSIKLRPDNVDGYISRAYLLQKKKKYKEALADLNRATQLNPFNQEAYYARSMIFFDLGEYSRGISEAIRVVELNPEDINNRNNLAFLYERFGYPDKAKNEYDKIIELLKREHDDESYFKFFYDRGNQYLFKGEYDKAIHDFIKVEDYRSKNIKNISNKVNKEICKDCKSKGIKCNDKFNTNILINFLPDNYAEIYLVLGDAYFSKGDLNKALINYQEIIILNPKNDTAWYKEASVYSSKKEIGRALGCLYKAVKLNLIWKAKAKKDNNFKALWNDPEFKRIVK